uniref:Ig-like domain-containing protein n=1 Tax=Oreochromis niloticus TaxID=8128 RepID=A0A669C4N0_ORENI
MKDFLLCRFLDHPLTELCLYTDAPSGVMIYTRNEVELRVKNTLICHVTGFYPAPVKVSWTKNGQITTGGSSINTPYPNKDGTFTQIARLQFIPQQGDVYSCTVEHLHASLSEPLITDWGKYLILHDDLLMT